jgi:predicted TIM-barrel fold metal-dependent hydrolase
VIVSSDGHAAANMPDYRPYISSGWRDEFDAFCEVHRELGFRTHDVEALLLRTDPDVADSWAKEALESRRCDGVSDPQQRSVEMDRQGIVAEVLFPDFGLPFELMSPFSDAAKGYDRERSKDEIEVGNTAHNRWLADFCASAPERFAGLAMVSFADVEATIREIHWARGAGLRGIVLPAFEDNRPVFDPIFDPIWSVLEDLDMPVNSHGSISSTTLQGRLPSDVLSHAPHPGVGIPIIVNRVLFFCHELLVQLIWGGVLERHPNLQFVLTEQQSGWVISALEGMDFRYTGSYAPRDLRDLVRHKPSEYFARQCHLGSSLFSKSEAEARHQIGVEKIQIGADYPHHEGTWAAGPGTVEWLRATLGASGVPAGEARLMIGGNAIRLWGFDEQVLKARADVIGPRMGDVLTAPTKDWYPRGDVHRPLAG